MANAFELITRLRGDGPIFAEDSGDSATLDGSGIEEK